MADWKNTDLAWGLTLAAWGVTGMLAAALFVMELGAVHHDLHCPEHGTHAVRGA